VDYQAGILFAGHLGDQVGNPLFDGQLPVFVFVELAVPV
jgi:hypothetical protein